MKPGRKHGLPTQRPCEIHVQNAKKRLHKINLFTLLKVDEAQQCPTGCSVAVAEGKFCFGLNDKAGMLAKERFLAWLQDLSN